MLTQNHPFHLVNISPWPLMGSLASLFMTLGMIELFLNMSINLLILGLILMIFTVYQWWRDVTRESTFQGHHSNKVEKNMQLGMILFITSEIFFFLSFFWAFFHSSLNPNIELSSTWPPLSIMPFNPFHVPLLNTIILLSSGVTMTWAHHALMNNNFTQTSQSLLLTIILGIYFSILQGMEYNEAPFSISDSIYGASFFMATGFHGLHVIIGTTFILVIFLRNLSFHFSENHHFGFEAAAWYWHFVDVVWLFLYISIYWWSN